MYNIYTDPSIHPCIARPNGVNLSYPSMCQTKFGPYKVVTKQILYLVDIILCYNTAFFSNI